jgi:O-succinylbenzoic acid--CoA ligase
VTLRDQLVDWGSSESHLLLNPRLSKSETDGLVLSKLAQLPSHVWLASSGTTGGLKLYALSKTAFLVSAEAVNAHLKVKKADIWLNVLPLFHVGGLSIWARAYLTNSRIVDRGQDAWSAEKFHGWTSESQATLTSLVPTQVHDLVQYGKPAPLSLRAIVVGGGALSPELYKNARKLGFRVLPSYGMTECCSQIATADLSSLADDAMDFPKYKILSHVQLKEEDGRLAVKTAALFTAQAIWRAGEVPYAEILWRAGEWYMTADAGEMQNEFLTNLSRHDDHVKISGELVSVSKVRGAWDQYYSTLVTNASTTNWAMMAQANARLGAEIALILPHILQKLAPEWVRKFNATISPVERVRCVYYVDQIPRTPLEKINYADLKKNLGIV